MSSVQTFNYGENTYRERSALSKEAGAILALGASAVLAKALPSFSNPFLKQMTKEHSRNGLYKDAFINSIKLSGLEEKGLTFENTDFTNADRNLLKSNPSVKVQHHDIKAGLNACYIPSEKKVLLNAEKASISGFHEIGHAMNHLNSKIGRVLQACRKPGYIIAGLMSLISFENRTKPKEAERNAYDIVLDNCGKIAFAALLPTVIEEAMASYKGIKLAQKAGLKELVIKNLRKFYGKALLSYGGYAVIAGLSAFAVSKIKQIFTRPKKIENQYY